MKMKIMNFKMRTRTAINSVQPCCKNFIIIIIVRGVECWGVNNMDLRKSGKRERESWWLSDFSTAIDLYRAT